MRTSRSSNPAMFMRIAVLAALAGSTAGCGDTNITVPSSEGLAGMSVEGVGRVEVTPDTLVVALGVESTAPTAPEAFDAATASASRMIDAIKEAGVPDEEIKTVSLEVRELRPQEPPVPVDGVAAIAAPAGFVGAQRIRIRILDLEIAGEVVDAAVQAGGEDSRVFDMFLEIADPEAAIEQARQAAVEDALNRAEELADAAGIDLGAPTSIQEGHAPSLPALELAVPSAGTTSAAGAGAGAVADAATSIEPGTSRVEVRVQVRFSIQK